MRKNSAPSGCVRKSELYWQHWLQKTEAQFCNQCCQYKSAQKEPKIVQFHKKCQIHANSDVQGKINFFITNSDSTLHKYMKFAFIVTCSVFLDSE